jgi:hypothetical protein
MQMILLIIEIALAALSLTLEILFPQTLPGILVGVFIGLFCGNLIGIILVSKPTTTLKTPQTPQTIPLTKPSTPELKVNETKPIKTSSDSPFVISPTVANTSTTRAIPDKSELMNRILKLSEIVQSCQDLVENESELSKKEEARLYLRRDEFKKLFREVKSTNLDSF